MEPENKGAAHQCAAPTQLHLLIYSCARKLLANRWADFSKSARTFQVTISLDHRWAHSPKLF